MCRCWRGKLTASGEVGAPGEAALKPVEAEGRKSIDPATTQHRPTVVEPAMVTRPNRNSATLSLATGIQS